MKNVDLIVLRAITTQQKRLSLSNKKLYHLPYNIEFLNWLVILDLRSNNLSDLPILPKHLQSINLGHNWFTTIPNSVFELTSLKSISMYSNQLQSIPSTIFAHLKYLSSSHNKLTTLPESMCSMLNKLEYLNLGYNHILTLPFNFGLLQNMKTLLLHKNFLTRLPETFGQLKSLTVLDLAGNNLQLLPSNFTQLKLKEFYAEANPFTRNDLFTSTYKENVLTLKEIVLRKLSRLGFIDIGVSNPWLESIIGSKQWQTAGFCALCKNPFVTWWLESVRFANRKELIISKKSQLNKASPEVLYPLRTLFCSYHCLNSSGNCYELSVG
ncbi:Leucine-rich repeat-containing protein 69 [Schistosoma haematobium]|uniref:Leucine-rich repeat-containing protein 69 n=1 Tax=Schistosoma haematobium TaxID=6185 RepID=A0A6A5CX62_SCHHA|nr:Leucine-rich repeat-containing protein 69 [Schistosoma haematobium]KAH9589872.1 Leucine-rich repeat-containing protein 69 [Schistosoma haematobium]